MRDMQTIDLGTTSALEEQYLVLERLEAISAAGTGPSWSDDHEIHTLMLRYEESSRRVAARLTA
ncbi:MAG: hypothetical protein JWM98_1834 [Thermoleophilia bacterium]|nr:hypothetical protein [Thermoleophilia bacterium]